MTTLGEVCVRVNKTDPRATPDTDFTYLDIAAIDNNVGEIVAPKWYKGAQAPSRARQVVKSGDVLFSTVRTYLKNIAQVPEQYDGQIASTGFTVIRPSRYVSSKFIFYFVQTDAFLDPLNEKQRGTSYPAVRDSDVFAQPIPLPPTGEQRRIVEKVEELLTRLEAGVRSLKQAQALLKQYRQSVLKAAVEGELSREWREVHKGEIVPASALLDRMLTHRRERWEAAELAKMKATGNIPKSDKWKERYRAPRVPKTEDLPTLPEEWTWASPDQLAADEEYSLAIGPFGSNLKVN